MKTSSTIIASLLCFLIFTGSTCKKDDFVLADTVKLKAVISDTNEIIHLGDTIKIKLVLPNVLQAIDSYGNFNNVNLSSLQEAWYDMRFYRLDTATRSSTLFWGNTAYNFATIGYINGGGVYNTTTTPFTSVLNIVPPTKGVYYVSITPQPGHLRANNSYNANLIVNYDVPNKHWNMLAYYYNKFYGTNINDFLASAQATDNDGYGYYGFRVN